MNLNLKTPIAFFDIESTGTNVATDRIVEISILKVHPQGSQETKTFLVNPTIPSPRKAL
jgi:DNA polymerase III subunit epsilon